MENRNKYIRLACVACQQKIGFVRSFDNTLYAAVDDVLAAVGDSGDVIGDDVMNRSASELIADLFTFTREVIDDPGGTYFCAVDNEIHLVELGVLRRILHNIPRCFASPVKSYLIRWFEVRHAEFLDDPNAFFADGEEEVPTSRHLSAETAQRIVSELKEDMPLDEMTALADVREVLMRHLFDAIGYDSGGVIGTMPQPEYIKHVRSLVQQCDQRLKGGDR